MHFHMCGVDVGLLVWCDGMEWLIPFWFGCYYGMECHIPDPYNLNS